MHNGINLCGQRIVRSNRGWFNRLHQTCSNNFCIYEIENVMYSRSCEPGFDVFILIMVYAIACSSLWILAGVVALHASCNMSKGQAMTSLVIFLIGYAVFIGLFTVTTLWINAMWEDVSDFQCKNVEHIENQVLSIILFMLLLPLFLAIATAFTLVSLHLLIQQQ